jgi:GNAT superfamily N-acetyltransferase
MLDNYDFYRLSKYSDTLSFTCGETEGEKDLNDFFLNEALLYEKELLAVTYLFQDNKNIVAFFSVKNDRISKSKDDVEIEINIPEPKRIYSSYPAVKIARFGVHKNYQGRGIGTAIINFIKSFFIKDHKTGCRFITVDAYKNNKTLGFYRKNGFKPLSDKDKNKETRGLFLDLKPRESGKKGSIIAT